MDRMKHRQSKVGQVVQKIKDSGNRCALSGWAISPQCFELDHIVSMNDGGGDEVDNLQAVHPLVNRAKGTMGNQQFIEMCRAVTMHIAGVPDTVEGDELQMMKKQITELLATPPGEVGSPAS